MPDFFRQNDFYSNFVHIIDVAVITPVLKTLNDLYQQVSEFAKTTTTKLSEEKFITWSSTFDEMYTKMEGSPSIILGF